jgi:hypothetical protein
MESSPSPSWEATGPAEPLITTSSTWHSTTIVAVVPAPLIPSCSFLSTLFFGPLFGLSSVVGLGLDLRVELPGLLALGGVSAGERAVAEVGGTPRANPAGSGTGRLELGLGLGELAAAAGSGGDCPDPGRKET